ncbi:DAK2 domain-containing protein [Parabacteroides sp. PF5-9]|uniref:DAK2 domain-containing protein n=1 Tax=Parabacteroides sp. PF5-9 TaxID=1742404 RepID=UPI002475590D|nr:DAK2 domain-containing protein [Parabacteroides sp. PF5-9]MDH6358349.1 dihydroxyacetone kinase-like protein [Parabacteroides sp. PF5-9]
MKILTIEVFKAMLQHALVCLKAREDEFSRLDAVIGDGDHGTAIVTAFTVITNVAQQGVTFKSMLGDMGMRVMLEVSGSTSTLLGAFFLGMSDHVQEDTVLDAAALKRMFAGGLANVQQQTKATIGDKTMMDVLIPAVRTMQDVTSEEIHILFSEAANVANGGAEQTVHMQAKFGRARNYGERSVGTMDSGAASWACMFSAFAEELNKNQ